MKTKLSTRRLIVSGDMVELYEYQFPFAYNLAPLRLSGGVLSAGEVEGHSRERRNDNLGYVRSQIRRLVECNERAFGYVPCFLTFTFRDNITDVAEANALFHDFIRRFSYKVGTRLRYLAIVEFQARGAVHYHCVFFNLPLEYEIRERRTRFIAGIWRNGSVDVERIRHAASASAYICKYLDKGVHDRRLIGKKSFFMSRSLLRPLQFRDDTRIDTIIASFKLRTTRVESYSSLSRGIVKYNQYHVER